MDRDQEISLETETAENSFVGRYRLGSVLGRGSISIVYAALDTIMNRELAIKLIRAEFRSANNLEKLWQRFRKEAAACSVLKHESIVQVLSYGETEYYLLSCKSGKKSAGLKELGKTKNDLLQNDIKHNSSVVALFSLAEFYAQASNKLEAMTLYEELFKQKAADNYDCSITEDDWKQWRKQMEKLKSESEKGR